MPVEPPVSSRRRLDEPLSTVAGAHVAGEPGDVRAILAELTCKRLERPVRAGAALYTYAGVGHFFTDAQLPDYDGAAADLAWQRACALLETLR